MNRIYELAEQADEYAKKYVAECKHYGYQMEYNEFQTRFEEKFAELIIRECLVQVCDEVQYQYDWKLADAVTKRVLEHFGVE